MDENEEIKLENQNMESNEAGVAQSPPANIPSTPKRKRGRPRALNNHVTVKDVVDTINGTGGMILESVKLLGISVTEFYQKFRYNPKVEEALKMAHRIGFDEVTDVLIKRALEGDLKAISLYLKYNPLAKENQWVENQTLTLKEEKPLSNEEKQDLAKQLFG